VSEDLLDIFVTEAGELVDRAAQDLLALEAAPEDLGAQESLFRAVHTLKGSAGLIGFAAMGELFHAAEDRLSELRSADGSLDRALGEALGAALGLAEGWVAAVARSGALPLGAEQQAAPVAARLRGAAASQSAAAPPASRTAPEWAEPLLAAAAPSGPAVAIRYRPRPDSYFAGVDPVAVLGAAPELRAVSVAPREPFGALADYDPFTCNLLLTALSAAPLAEVRQAFRFVADEVELVEVEGRGEPAVSPEAAATGRDRGTSRTLRVESVRIDELSGAVEELVVAKNALAHLAEQAVTAADPALARALAEFQIGLDRRISRLHDSVTRLRLAPLAPLFRRFPRLVRETAAELGKSAELALWGEDVEVDKAIVDALFEPLLHLVRNAIDHGVEPPAQRAAAGKPAQGALRLSARTSGERVLLELADDGRGIDPGRIRESARARGMLDADALARLSDAQAMELIFSPGFSTAARVSDLSGRGVGLDAVRAAVLSLGGRIEVRSRPGEGATFLISLPLRLRLAQLMMVEAAGEPFGVPLEALIETVRAPRDRLTPVRAGQAFVWRDRPVPVLELSQLLRLPPARAADDELRLMIVQAGDEPAAIAVDAFGERIEAPLRPMTRLLAGVPGLAGSTLLGDGRVLMILDLEALIG
jgi:two-component system chemotaxis sensor kinase CheA